MTFPKLLNKKQGKMVRNKVTSAKLLKTLFQRKISQITENTVPEKEKVKMTYQDVMDS